MTIPAVTISELDGALGVLPTSAGNVLAVVGCSSAGMAAVPSTFARVQDLVAAYGYGDGVEAAAYHIKSTGRPVCFTRAEDATDGSGTAVTYTGSGTSVVTLDVDPVHPFGLFEAKVLVVLGGTIGTGPITIRYSLDDGRTYSPKISLGTATTYTVPNSGVVFNFAAGTLVTGDYWTCRTAGMRWDSTTLSAALTALNQSSVAWSQVLVAGIALPADVDTIDGLVAGWRSSNRRRSYILSARVPTIAESEATYLSSLTSAWSAKATTYGSVCAGACEAVSGVSGRRYMMPTAVVVASRQATVDEHVNVAAINLGALPVTIKDAVGNPKHHDEFISPGLDDARFITLRTFGDSPQGVYITRPRIFSAEGSDFRLIPHRRVIDIAENALNAYFVRRLNEPVQVDSETGFITESEAIEIEEGAIATLTAVLLQAPKASGVQFTLSRTDAILTTFTLTGDARILPLGYGEYINVSVGYTNPALNIA